MVIAGTVQAAPLATVRRETCGWVLLMLGSPHGIRGGALPRRSLLGVDLARYLLFRGEFVNVCVVDARWCWWDGCDGPTVWEIRITSGDEASREDTMAS